MKALVLKKYGKTGLIEFDSVSPPALGDNELLLNVHAVGLNAIDCMIPKGLFKPILPLTLPAVVGSDLSGVIEAVGKNVTRFKKGDAIYASIFDMDRGALAEYALVPEHAAALKPQNLSFVEAASLPMVALTSWQAFERAQVRAGTKVFIPAGSGGIGTFAIQLAKHLGATVATTTSLPNASLVTGLGADLVIDYKSQDVENVLSGYDVVLGTVRGDSIEKSLQILNSGAEVVSLVGPPDLPFARQRGMNKIMKMIFWILSRKIISQARRHKSKYSFLFVRPDGAQLSEIATLIEDGQLKPVIDKVFPFEESLEGLSYLEKGHAKGKVVIKLK